MRASDRLPPVASLDSLPSQLNTAKIAERPPVFLTTYNRSLLPRPDGHSTRFKTSERTGDQRARAQYLLPNVQPRLINPGLKTHACVPW